MSKIQKELADAAEVDPKRGESRQDYLLRLAMAVNKLPEAAWEKLSKDAQNWTNNAADAANKRNDIPEFKDAEQESSGRRRVSDDAPYEPKVKDDVKVTTKRGKVVSGKIVEMDKEVIVLKNTEGAEEEISRDRIEKIEPLVGGSSGRSEAKEDEGPRDPKVGETITVTTKRGRVVTGELIEDTKELFVLKVNGEVEEFDKDRVESVKIEGASKASSGGSSRRSADNADKGEPEKKGDEDKRTRSTNAGVSVGTRIRELIVANMDVKEEEIGKLLKKENLEFRENTLSLNYADAHKMIKLLKEAGKLK